MAAFLQTLAQGLISLRRQSTVPLSPYELLAVRELCLLAQAHSQQPFSLVASRSIPYHNHAHAQPAHSLVSASASKLDPHANHGNLQSKMPGQNNMRQSYANTDRGLLRIFTKLVPVHATLERACTRHAETSLQETQRASTATALPPQQLRLSRAKAHHGPTNHLPVLCPSQRLLSVLPHGNPNTQCRWLSARASGAAMFPEIEEAPHTSTVVPHPLPQSHSGIRTGSKKQADEWPSADYLSDARSAIFQKEAFIIDMDGVVYRGSNLLPGVREFVQWLLDGNKRFLFLTNSSDRTREELQQKLARMGIDVETEHFYTAALATAAFLSSQRPNGSAYVIGDPGVMSALYDVGYSMNDVNPDYVVVGETRNYNYERLEHAVHLVLNGSKLIGTNCDKTDPSPDHPGEVIPAAGSIIKPIESATGLQAYFVGKPNPLMMRSALATLGAHRRSTIIIGDRMDTDILGGLEASIDSALVLSGVTSLPEMRRFAYMPRFVLRGLVDLVPDGVEMSSVAKC